MEEGQPDRARVADAAWEIAGRQVLKDPQAPMPPGREPFIGVARDGSASWDAGLAADDGTEINVDNTEGGSTCREWMEEDLLGRAHMARD